MLLKFGQAVPEIFLILVFKKGGFCGQELAKAELHTWSDTKNKTFDGFFVVLWG